MDRTFWQAFLTSDEPVPAGHSIDELTPELLGYLGSPEAWLRDEVAYLVLDSWISHGFYTPEQLRELLTQLAANLQNGLGEIGDDRVFLRSFSLLVANEILERDNLHPFLSEAELREWLERALHYLAAERDLRGYTGAHGWAHTAAHTADTLWVLSRSRYLGAADLVRMLDAIADKVSAPVAQVYIYGEDQRLASAVMSILRRDLLDMAALNAWLARLVDPGSTFWRAGDFAQEAASALHNTKLFLHSTYSQLLLGSRVPHRHPDPAYFERAPAVRAALLPALAEAARTLEPIFYRAP
jgi:hypothetical protein